MERLRLWLKRRSFKLELVAGAFDEVELLSRVVTLDAQASYQKKLSACIHECGHVQIFLSRCKNPRERVCGATLKEDIASVGRCDKRGRRSRIALLQEEMEAWEAGLRLAASLKIRYAKGELERVRTECLMSYVAHVAAPMRQNKTEAVAWEKLSSAMKQYVSVVRRRSVRSVRKTQTKRS